MSKKLFHRKRLICWLPVIAIQLVVPEILRGQMIIPSQPLTIPSESNGEYPTAAPDRNGFSVSIRTALLSEFVNRETVKKNDVVTQVMEADVRGVQTTTTSIGVQTLASDNVARLEILATGNVNSNTVGYTPQAQVTTAGSHTFDVRKPVFFDGQQFLTKPAFGRLQARQFPQNVNTLASGVPLFGPIGNQIAWNEVYRRMPVTDAIVVRKVADDVMPQINSGVDEQLTELNRSWHRFRRSIDMAFPASRISWSAQTDNDSMSIAARNSAVILPAIQTLTSNLEPAEVASIVVAEAAVNTWLESQSIAGLTVTDAAMQKIFEAVREADNPGTILSALKNPDTLNAEPTLFSIHLADVVPLRLGFADGHLTVQLQFQILPKSGIPSQMHLMKIKLKGQDASDGIWSVSLREISVDPADSNQLPDGWTTLISNQARQIVDNAPPVNLPRTLDLKHVNEKLPLLQIHRIQTDRGWFRISVRMEEPVSQITRRR